MTERKGKQLNRVADELKADGKVSAHQMTYRLGITRLAAIIHTLRHIYGWDIETLPRKEDHMAVYALRSKPASWSLPKKTTPKRTWSCTTCGQVSGGHLVERTPTMARGICGTCEGDRLFRFA